MRNIKQILGKAALALTSMAGAEQTAQHLRAEDNLQEQVRETKPETDERKVMTESRDHESAKSAAWCLTSLTLGAVAALAGAKDKSGRGR